MLTCTWCFTNFGSLKIMLLTSMTSVKKCKMNLLTVHVHVHIVQFTPLHKAQYITQIITCTCISLVTTHAHVHVPAMTTRCS